LREIQRRGGVTVSGGVPAFPFVTGFGEMAFREACGVPVRLEQVECWSRNAWAFVQVGDSDLFEVGDADSNREARRGEGTTPFLESFDLLGEVDVLEYRIGEHHFDRPVRESEVNGVALAYIEPVRRV
jgi:hypothetical protein